MKSTGETPARLPLGRVAAYSAVACGIVAIFLLCWLLRDVLLLAFGAILVAVIIRACARPLITRAGFREKWAVATVVIVLLAATAGLSWLFGQQVAAQLEGVGERIPRAIESVRAWMEGNPAGRFVLERASELAGEGDWLENVQTFATVGFAGIAHAFLMLFAGIYIATNPALYLRGLVRLFPNQQRAKVEDALLKSGGALSKWLLGQVVSMISVGTLTGLGLWVVGAPLPLALGVMAGLLEFIPVVGPFIALVPGVLVAFTEGPQIALYALIVFLAVQQIEGNVIMPLAQRWAVELPPALGLISLVAFGLLFGILGIFFGSPLAVVVMCIVQALYIKRGLEKQHPPTGVEKARLRG
jgi:predicted PurR-regulated permease PerM